MIPQILKTTFAGTLFVLCTMLCTVSALGQLDCEAHWQLGFGLPHGQYDEVRVFTVFDDGGGPALYAGGLGAFIGGEQFKSIGKWNGSGWSPVGGGVNGAVSALVVHDDGSGPALFAGGFFPTAGGVPAWHIAKWDGRTWSPLGSGLNDEVSCMVSVPGVNGGLYVGGYFTHAGGVLSRKVAKWDGSNWIPMGMPVTGSDCAALAWFDDGSGSGPALYAGVTSSNFMFRWNGAEWIEIDAPGGRIHALTIFDEDGDGPNPPALFAGAGAVARFNGNVWTTVGGNFSVPGGNSHVYSLEVITDRGGTPSLYAGGKFTSIGGVTIRRVARWDGQAWQEVGGGLGSATARFPEVLDLCAFDDGTGSGPLLFAGLNSSFDSLVVRLNREQWIPAGNDDFNGLTDDVKAIVEFDDGTGPTICIAGTFTNPDRVAKWTGVGWEEIGGGISGSVNALAVYDNDGAGPGAAELFATGNFTMAGGIEANSIARWNGSTWVPLGNGLRRALAVGTGIAMKVFDPDGPGPAKPVLYVAGFFDSANGQPSQNVAFWNGTTLVPLSIALNDTVAALAVYDDDGTGPNLPALFAGGGFTGQIAKLAGTTWSTVGGGITSPSDGGVGCLEVFDPDASGPEPPALYAGGSFTTAGGQPATNIACWNGSTWAPVAGGVAGQGVSVLQACDGPRLIGGGDFSSVSGIPYTNLAVLNDNAWSALEGDVNVVTESASVAALTLLRRTDIAGMQAGLLVGGEFHSAGNAASSNFAVLTTASPVITVPPLDQFVAPNQTAQLTVEATGLGPLQFQWRKAGIDLIDQGSISGSQTSILTITRVSSSDIGYYDVVVSSPPCADVISQSVALKFPPPPSNDVCANAPIALSGSYSFSTISATTDGPEEPNACAGGSTSIHNDVWYKYVAQCNGIATISTCGASFNTKLAAYLTCPAGSNQSIACNDDHCGGSSQMTFPVTNNTLYRIRIGSPDGTTGTGTLVITCSIPPPCDADLNGDNTVGVPDLLALLNTWGPCAPPCDADVAPRGAPDGTVGTPDLLALIDAWGQCP